MGGFFLLVELHHCIGGSAINGATPSSFITQMKMTYLSPPPPNMNLIREVYDSLGNDSLTLFARNHWATGRLWQYYIILPTVKGGIISDALFA